MVVPLMAVAAGMQVMSSMQKKDAYKFNYDMQKINSKINEANIRTQTDFQIEQQLKGFNEFVDQHNSLVGQQKSVLATQQVNIKSSAYTEVRSQGEKDYYENVNILEDNIQDLKTQQNLSLLANNTQLAAQNAEKESNISANRINTIAQLGTMAFTYGAMTGKPQATTPQPQGGVTPGQNKLALTIFG